jgi:flagellar motility protein MotE (MotC chaperone)
MAKGFKTGGRRAGQPNKLTAELREILGEIVKQQLLNLPELLSQMEAKDAAMILEKFTGYVMPKMESEEAAELAEQVIIQVHKDL